MAYTRWIKNIYDDYDPDQEYDYDSMIECFKNKIAINMKDTRKHYPSDRGTKLYSNGKRKQDPFLYTGTGGNVSFILIKFC